MKNNIYPDNKISTRQLTQIFRSPTIHKIDISQLYENVTITFEERESLCEDFPSDGIFQILFQNVQRFTINYIKNDINKCTHGSFDGIKEFVKERIGNKNFYRITTYGDRITTYEDNVPYPVLEIVFENVNIVYLGDSWCPCPKL